MLILYAVLGTKEALWPVYATYCSCGDSLDPGKLSGPNLFTLLSKLGVLSDKTLLSDVGILLYQISSHSLSTLSPYDTSISKLAVGSGSSAQGNNSSGGQTESPSLSFEEFLVFLYAFSQLRFEGVMISPSALEDDETAVSTTDGQTDTSTSLPSSRKSDRRRSLMRSADMRKSETWFNKWLQLMGSSGSFRHLLEECVLPILKKQTLLAFPEDARLRDKFACVFSLEVLQAIEGAEGPLQSFFESERMSATTASISSSISLSSSTDSHQSANSGSSTASRAIEINVIMTVLKRINLVPTVINEPQVAQLIRDVMPEDISKRFTGNNAVNAVNDSMSNNGASNNNIHNNGSGSSGSSSTSSGNVQMDGGGGEKPCLLFPQWEWVLAVVAFQAVETAIAQSTIYTNPNKIPALVAGVITSIASAITQY